MRGVLGLFMLALAVPALAQLNGADFKVLNDLPGLPKGAIVTASKGGQQEKYTFMFPCYPALTKPCADLDKNYEGLIGANFIIQLTPTLSTISYFAPGKQEVQIVSKYFAAARGLQRTGVTAGTVFAQCMSGKPGTLKPADVYARMANILKAYFQGKTSVS